MAKVLSLLEPNETFVKTGVHCQIVSELVEINEKSEKFHWNFSNQLLNF